jgi:hypothetical protein
MLLGDIMSVYSEDHMNQVNVPCEQNSVFLNVKVSDANSNHFTWAVP